MLSRGMNRFGTTTRDVSLFLSFVYWRHTNHTPTASLHIKMVWFLLFSLFMPCAKSSSTWKLSK